MNGMGCMDGIGQKRRSDVCNESADVERQGGPGKAVQARWSRQAGVLMML